MNDRLKTANLLLREARKSERKSISFLEGGETNRIGGRSIDIEQIGHTFLLYLREYYPPNEIPEDILNKCKRLIRLLEYSSEEINEFMKTWEEYENE